MSSLSVAKSDQPRLSRGWRRMQEIAHESEAERRAIEAALLADLGRRATAVDRVAIETLSAAMVRARRLRAMRRNDTEQTRLIAHLLAYQNETSAAGACNWPVRARLLRSESAHRPSSRPFPLE
jgi:hypothetical protein